MDPGNKAMSFATKKTIDVVIQLLTVQKIFWNFREEHDFFAKFILYLIKGINSLYPTIGQNVLKKSNRRHLRFYRRDLIKVKFPVRSRSFFGQIFLIDLINFLVI